jgi:hypothetical protein
MRQKPKKSPPEALAPVAPEILDQFVCEGPLTAAEVETAGRRLKKALIERALGAELSHHLGYPPGAAKPDATTSHRNGTSGKTVLTDDGPVPIAVPHDRDGTFEPQLIGKHERRFTGFDEKVIALYARGLTVREIQAFLAEMYAVDVSPDLISTVTEAVAAEVSAWQARPLEPLYPVVFFDALRVKMRDEGVVRRRRCRPVSCICCGTASTMRRGRSGEPSRRPSGRSTRHHRPPPPRPPWRRWRPDRGASGFHRSSRAGVGRGRR